MGSPSGSTNRTNPSIDTTDRAGQTRIPRAPAQQFNNAVDAQQSGAGSPSTVRDTQSQLNALGYDTGGVDGVAGARTDAAIRAFQAANGLAVDGIAGPQTLAAMAKAKADAVHSAPPARSFADRQSDIDNIATASPAAAQAMRNELAADVENRVAEIDNDLQNLPSSSFSGYVRLDLQAERDELARLLPVEPLSTVPEDPQAKADARALAANDAGGDYDHIINPSTGSGYTDAEVRDLMALPEITDGSDRRNFIKAAELKNDPSILEDFDQRLDDYNNLKTAVAQTYDNRVNELMNQNGYDRTVAEDLASLEFQNSGLPTHALPGQAKGLNFENRSDGEVYTLPSDPNDLHNFEAGSTEYRQFKEAIGQKFDASVDEVVKNQGIDRAVAERLVAMQFSSSGVPAHALPDNVSGFDPIEVLQRQGDVFDTALSTANDDGSSGLIKNLNDLVGRNGPDGFTATSDIDAIVANPDQFDADVVATAIVLQNAINKPENEDFKAQFEKPSFWQQVKESDWLDPDTDSFVVNISRAISTNGVSLLGANEFHDRVVEEGPGVLRQVNNSLNELSIENQVRLAFTDRDQLIENYKSFGGGAVDFGVDTAKLGVGVIGLSNPAIAAQIHQHTGTNVYAETYSAITNGTTAYINGPDEFARNIVGYDQFVNDPYRWAGNQAPDIVLEILGTKGASKAARGARAVDAAGDTAQAGTRVLSRSQDLIDGLDAQLLRADIEDGVPIDFLQLPDGTHIKVKELADGGYDLSYPDGPPPPRAEDFRSPPAPRAEDFVSDAPPPSPRAEDFRFDAPPTPKAEDAILLNDDLRVVNPRYVGDPGPGSGVPNRWENCVACAQAMDAHLAGSPASALPGVARTPDVLEDWIGANFRKVASPDAIVDELLVAGDGARGIVLGDRGPDRVGHAFNVVNEDGVIRFVDGQNGGFPATFDGQGYVEFQFLRTDSPGASGAADGKGPATASSGGRFAGDDAVRLSDDAWTGGSELIDGFSPATQTGAVPRLAQSEGRGIVQKTLQFDDRDFQYLHVVNDPASNAKSLIIEYSDGRLELGPQLVDDPVDIARGSDDVLQKPSYELSRLDDGAEVWAMRKEIDPKLAREVAHRDIKGGDNYSGAADDLRLDPNTGAVFDPEGFEIGNLNNYFS